MKAWRVLLALAAVLPACGGTPPPGGPAVVVSADTTLATVIALPNKSTSFRFAVLGDFGDGSLPQYQTAAQMDTVRRHFPFDHVLLAGDDLYDGAQPQDYQVKFEIPYKPLLDSGVKFLASLGNHDDRNERYYKGFNMGGKLYYSWKAPKQNVRFFFLESTYPDSEQIAWVGQELKGSKEDWKIAVFHHPLYSSGRTHGPDLNLRKLLEPLFIEYNVSVAFAGHDHVYERLKPQQGIVYFVVGSGGKLRAGDINRNSGLTEKGFDTDNAFLVGEIDGDRLTFQAISRTGKVVDSGIITRRKSGSSAASP